jgi:hypothetical protein
MPAHAAPAWCCIGRINLVSRWARGVPSAAVSNDNSRPLEGVSLASFPPSFHLLDMARNTKPSPSTPAPGGQKLRQTQAEYSAARPPPEPGTKTMMSSAKMYVCRRCHANFKTGDGKPDLRMPGLGKCNACVALAAAAAGGSGPTGST